MYLVISATHRLEISYLIRETTMDITPESSKIKQDRDSLYDYKLTLENTLASGCHPEEFDKLNKLKHAFDIVMRRILENENKANWSN